MKRFRRQTGILFLIVMVDLLLALNLARLAGGERKVCVSEGESALPVSEAGDGTLERGTGNGEEQEGEERSRAERIGFWLSPLTTAPTRSARRSCWTA
ncbi:MAG: hypothetical protein ACLTF1_14730 [Clostridium sp.]